MLKRAAIFLASVAALFGVSALFAPQLLAFPYKTQTAVGTVWSERPMQPAMLERAAEQAQARLATSPLSEDDEQRDIFLTDGGWRWHMLATSSSGAFAITRPISRAVIVNDTDPASGTVRNGFEVGGERTLGAILAHEFTHGLIRRHFGTVQAQMLPQWKVEGYADHVAGESSLSAADVAELEAAGIEHPALPYYHGRLRVAEVLEANGNDIDALFASEDE